LVVEDIVDHEVSCPLTGGLVSKRSRLLASFDNNEDAVIACTGTLNDKPPSLLPIPVDGSGQPLLSLELTSLPTFQVPMDNCREEAVFEGQNIVCW